MPITWGAAANFAVHDSVVLQNCGGLDGRVGTVTFVDAVKVRVQLFNDLGAPDGKPVGCHPSQVRAP